MKYLVDISPRQVQTIQKLLDKGSYETLAQFISASIENQIALEKNETTDLRPFILKEDLQPSLQNTLSVNNPEKYKIQNIPDFHSNVPMPGYEKLVFSSQNIPEQQIWIWGQINKIFPVKLGLRILHRALAEKQSIELNEFLELVTQEAVAYGNAIREYEKQNNKLRDKKISAALPSADEKSQTRYKFQFMAYLRKDGLLDGAMAIMRFCNISGGKRNGKSIIEITEEGLKFSVINNPVLDNNNFEASLSNEEAIFYLDHIKKSVKGEYAAVKWMLKEIDNGKNEREALNSEIEKKFGKTWKATPAVINTQRAGLTARMFELGLIEKEKEGVYVKYKLSAFGEQYLKK